MRRGVFDGHVIYINIVTVVVGAVDMWKMGKSPVLTRLRLWIIEGKLCLTYPQFTQIGSG